ncbi:MAG: DUF2784 domain-containing protein [Halioglobus sp.]
MIFTLLADVVLVLHVAFVAFVVLTVPCIYLGKACNWRWVSYFWLRVVHLAGIGIVTAQAWAGVVCPLTDLEMWLRRQGGEDTYAGSFIEHWLHRVLYWELPAWVFVAAYSLFAVLVIFTWIIVPPQKR